MVQVHGLSLQQSRAVLSMSADVIHGDDRSSLLVTWRRILASGDPDQAAGTT